MADTVLDYNIRLIENGANNNTWGEKNNDNWQIAVNLFDGTTGITANLLTGWKVGGVAISSTAAELNKLAGTTGNVLTDAQADTLTKGFAVTTYSMGTITSGTLTPDFENGNQQKFTCNGAMTLAAPSGGDGTMIVKVTMGASAGTLSLSGFADQSGDAFTTTEGDTFACYITVIDGDALINIKVYG